MNAVEFSDGEFIVRFKDGDIFQFEYTYPVDGLWERVDEVFDITILDSPYHSKGNNLYDLYLDGREQKCGRIIPLSVILDDSYSILDDKHLKQYLFVATKWLLQNADNLQANKNLEKCYFDSAVLMIVHKPTVHDFNRDQYVLPLFKLGYFYYDSESKAVGVDGFHKTDCLLGKTRVDLKPENNVSFKSEGYLNSLILKVLPRTDNLLARFVLLYQVVELYMEKLRRQQLDSFVADYNANHISAHEMLHRVSSINGEKEHVKKMFNKSCASERDFIESCKTLFRSISFIPDGKEESLGKYVYAFRNRVVHGYRDFLGVTEEFTNTVELFENIIVETISIIDFSL